MTERRPRWTIHSDRWHPCLRRLATEWLVSGGELIILGRSRGDTADELVNGLLSHRVVTDGVVTDGVDTELSRHDASGRLLVHLETMPARVAA